MLSENKKREPELHTDGRQLFQNVQKNKLEVTDQIMAISR